MKDKIRKILEQAKEQIKLNLDVENINASKRTSDSLQVVEYDGGVKLVIGGEDTAPLSTLEIGRPGGAVPFNFTEIIKQWIIDKGLSTNPIPYVRQPSDRWQPKYTPEERGLNAAAGAIVQKIKTIGTDRHIQPRNDIYSNIVEKTKEILKKEIFNYTANFVKTN